MRASTKVVAALVAAALMGGCAAPRPGVAAVVDGRTITHAQVDRATADLAPFFSSVPPANVAALLVITPPILAAADDAGFGVSADDALGWVVANGVVTQAEAAALGPDAVAVLRLAVLQGSIASEEQYQVVLAAEEEVRGSDVVVNPRYGAWEPETLSIVALETPWIVAGR